MNSEELELLLDEEKSATLDFKREQCPFAMGTVCAAQEVFLRQQQVLPSYAATHPFVIRRRLFNKGVIPNFPFAS